MAAEAPAEPVPEGEATEVGEASKRKRLKDGFNDRQWRRKCFHLRVWISPDFP